MIPLKKEWIGPVIFLFTISSFFNTDTSQNISIKLKKYWPFFLFLLIMLLGMVNTENSFVGWKNIETKLSFLILPIAFSISSIDFNTIKPKIFKSFIEGTLIAILFGVLNVTFNYFQTENLSLFYGKLAYFNHNSYLSLYINLSIIILYSFVFSKKDNFKISPLIAICLIAFFTIIIGLLASKAGLICLIIIHLISISIWSYKNRKYIIGLSILSGIALTFTSMYFTSNDFKSRIDEFTISLNGINNKNTTTQARISAWKSSIEVIKEYPLFGVGTGDVQKQLDNAHVNNGDLILYQKHLNAHNQFLQTGIAVGVIGLISLLILFILPLYKAFTSKNIVLFLLLLIILINLLFESMLEKQEGVVFISFFIALFALLYKPTRKNIS